MEIIFNKEFIPSRDTFTIGKSKLILTPNINPEYYLFKVPLYKEQALLAFPKFNTMGIGFAIEDYSWNTNYPYTVSAAEILEHIKGNKKYPQILDSVCLRVILMLQECCKTFMTETKNQLT